MIDLRLSFLVSNRLDKLTTSNLDKEVEHLKYLVRGKVKKQLNDIIKEHKEL